VKSSIQVSLISQQTWPTFELGLLRTALVVSQKQQRSFATPTLLRFICAMPKKKLPQGGRRGSAFAFNYEIIERTVCTKIDWKWKEGD